MNMHRIPLYDEITVGSVHSFTRTLTEKDERLFAELCGDASVLFAEDISGRGADKSAATRGKRVVHGMLAAALFSTLIDKHCPGPRNLLLSQTLAFRHPIFYRERVTVRGTVMEKSDSTRTLVLKTEILSGGVPAVFGEARIMVLP